MDDSELREVATRLESSLDINQATSHLFATNPFLWLTGTREALLCFAVACIRAAIAKIPEDDCRAEPSALKHRQIADSKTDYVLGAVQRINALPEDPLTISERRRKQWRNDRAWLVGCGVFAFVVLSLLVTGAMHWWEVITGQR